MASSKCAELRNETKRMCCTVKKVCLDVKINNNCDLVSYIWNEDLVKTQGP